MDRLVPALTALLLLLGAGAVPTLASAQDGDIDLDAMDSAAALQADAIAAALEGRWAEAKDLAIRALEREASITTAQARLVLARAHEALGELDAAERQVDNYLALPLLERDREKGVETKERIARACAARDTPPSTARTTPTPTPRATARPGLDAAARQRRAGGIGLLAGGAAPTIVGIWFVATDAHWAESGVASGTWAAIGAPTLVTGLALEVVGAVLLATKPEAKRRAVSVTPSVAPGPRGVHVGLRGTF